LAALAADAPSGAIPSNPAPATKPEAPNATVERTVRRVIMNVAPPGDDTVDRGKYPGDGLARVQTEAALLKSVAARASDHPDHA
jgi:hypothetical protein